MMVCPGCGSVVGFFRAAADTGEFTETIRCRRNGASYTLRQGVRQAPAVGKKTDKRRKSRRPIVIARRRAELRAAADSNTKTRKARSQSLSAPVVLAVHRHTSVAVSSNVTDISVSSGMTACAQAALKR